MKQTTTFVLLYIISTLISSGAVCAQSVYFFRDSDRSGYYDSGLAFQTAPSDILQAGPSGDKIPTSSNIVFQGDNSLRLTWTSRTGGNWDALVIAPGFPFQNITQTDTLAFWAYAPDGLTKDLLPVIFLEGAPGTTKSRRYPLADYTNDLPAQVWTQIKIPLTVFFNDPTQTNINFSQIKAVIFGQNTADGAPHTLYIDEVRTYRAQGIVPAPPAELRAFGYDSHTELRWRNLANPGLDSYRIYRSVNGGAYQLVRAVNRTDTLFIDFVRPIGNNLDLSYRVVGVNASGEESAQPAIATTRTYDMSDEELLTMVQAYTFRYFWDFAHPVSGLARERNTSGDLVTSGGSGFGIMAILVGIERGFITRAQGLARLSKIVNFLENADRFRGAFSHWLHGSSGRVIPFSAQDDGGDIVETAFLFEGLLTVREYFSEDTAEEIALREKITDMWEAIQWNWYRKQNQNVIFWHWSPNFNFAINLPVRGFNETHMVYLLALASPTNAVPSGLYTQGWAGGNYVNGNTYYGYTLDVGSGRGGPLFFSHYSYIGFDPRFVRDAYTNYFIRNRHHTLINRAYCIENPKNFPGYSDVSWGLTASDNPFGYLAHEPTPDRDNGTIAPTAALSSMPYTPDESLAALKHFYRDRGDRLWGPMGFYDAFNDAQDWVASSYLAIDQGPIICMIENHRSELLWRYFMQNPEIEIGLAKAGFVPDSLSVSAEQSLLKDVLAINIFPNPVHDRVIVELEQLQAAGVRVELWDATGQLRQILLDNEQLLPGTHRLEMNTTPFANGMYLLRVRTRNEQLTKKIIIHR
ncbi:MAG TPA: glucoamylase family protein [Saprospiraceae bacterium]|nr:glucoamylase family protein [Saprospiraceae bacterium]HMP25233.1 glucoamylase family protein [Saprospiraceae bacterium]